MYKIAPIYKYSESPDRCSSGDRVIQSMSSENALLANLKLHVQSKNGETEILNTYLENDLEICSTDILLGTPY